MSAKRTVPVDAYREQGEAGVARCAQCGAEFEPQGRFCPFDGSPLSLQRDALDAVAQEAWPIDGRYQFEAVIGQGNNGVVYRVRHARLGRAFALKILHCQGGVETPPVAHFMRNVRRVASVSHPNLCEVTDFGCLSDGRPYVVTELLPGKELGWWIQRQVQFSLPAVMHIANGVARGLAAAHAARLVLRTLKPSNVLIAAPLESGVIKITADMSPLEDEPSGFAANIRAFGAILEALLARHATAGGVSDASVSERPRLLADETAIDALRAMAHSCSDEDSTSQYTDGSALLQAFREIREPLHELPSQPANHVGATAATLSPSDSAWARFPSGAAAGEIELKGLHSSTRSTGRWVWAGLMGVGSLIALWVWQGHDRGIATPDTPAPTSAVPVASSSRYATDLRHRALPATSATADVPLDLQGLQEPREGAVRTVPTQAVEVVSASEPSTGGSDPSSVRKRQPVRVKRDTKQKATVDAKANSPQRTRSSGAVDLGEGDIIDPWSQR